MAYKAAEVFFFFFFFLQGESKTNLKFSSMTVSSDAKLQSIIYPGFWRVPQ